VGGYFNYGVGASRSVTGATAGGSPGLFNSGNALALGWMTDAVYINGSGLQLTTGWSAGGGFEYFWNRNFSSTIYGGYAQFSYNSTVINGRWFCGTAATQAAGAQINQTSVTIAAATACDPGYSLFQVGTHHDWFPVPGLRLAVDVLYTGVQTAYAGQTITLGKAVGARPTGAYGVRNLGITSVMFRAERSWGN
jgi:hypothetical protein